MYYYCGRSEWGDALKKLAGVQVFSQSREQLVCGLAPTGASHRPPLITAVMLVCVQLPLLSLGTGCTLMQSYTLRVEYNSTQGGGSK